MLFVCLPSLAQVGAIQGHSYLGGQQAVVSGMPSTNYLNGIVPYATVTVYLAGTQTQATIYSDGNLTPMSNPFHSNAVVPGGTDPGGYLFFASTNVGLDVCFSGGIYPNEYASTLCMKDIYPSQSFTPVSGVTSLNSLTGAVAIQGDSSITVTPSGQNINLHATGESGSGVQYNPTTSVYIMAGSSLLRDDNHAMSNAYTVTGGSANGATCSVTANNTLTTSDWVEMDQVTGFTAPTIGGIRAFGTNYTEFPVTSATSTSFTLGNCNFTATFTGGTAYQATYWVPYQTATKPFFNGHGSVIQLAQYPASGTYGLCTDMNTNYTAFYHTIMTTGAGPHYFIVNDCHNDFALATTAATVESAIQSLAANVHADGGIFVLAKPWSQGFGNFQTTSPNEGYQSEQFGLWVDSFIKSNTNFSTGQYADIIVDNDAIANNASDANVFADTVGRPAAGGANRIASEYNNILATQGTSRHYSTPWWQWRTDALTGQCLACGGTLTFTPPVDGYPELAVTNAAATQLLFQITNQGGGTISTSVGYFNTINVAPPSTGNVLSATFYAPNLGNGSSNQMQFGVSNLINGVPSSTNEAVIDQWNQVGAGSTSNYWFKEFSGQATPFFRAYATGELDLPQQAPSSGGPDCLQIAATTGAVTNTGAPCGGSASTYVNITPAVTVSGCTLASGACTVGTSTASVTLSSIPSGYNSIILRIAGSTVAGNDSFTIQLNGDTAADYTSTANGYSQAGTYQHYYSATTLGYIGYAVPYSYISGPGSQTDCTFVGYAIASAIDHTWTCNSSSNSNNGAFTGTFGGFWSKVAEGAINSISISGYTGSATDNIDVGTVITIYGIN